MNFKNWLLSEEIFPNKTATVYHRTKSLNDIGNILSKGFSAGDQGGCMYGCGLYTTFDLKSQFTDYMDRYGIYIIKFKVTNLENYLITPLNVAKYILGKDYKISDQFKKHLVNIIANDNKSKYGDKYDHHSIAHSMINELPSDSPWKDKLAQLIVYDQRQATDQYSSEFFKSLYDSFSRDAVFRKFDGAIYRGKNDGYCLLNYKPVNNPTITMLGYAEAEVDDTGKMNKLLNNQGWITSTIKEKIKSIWQRPAEKRPEVDLKDDLMRLKDLSQNNRLFNFKKALEKYPHLENSEFYEILKVAKDRAKILKELILHQNSTKSVPLTIDSDPHIGLSSINVMNVLDSDFENVKELAKVLGSDNIEKLSSEDISHLLQNASDESELQDKIEIILNYKTNIEPRTISNLLYYAFDKKEIAEKLGQERINKLNVLDIFDLIMYPGRTAREINRKEIAEILGQENINRLRPEFVKRLIHIVIAPLVDADRWQKDVHNQRIIYLFNQVEEMVEILGTENIRKLNQSDIDQITAELSDDHKKRFKELLSEHGYEL